MTPCDISIIIVLIISKHIPTPSLVPLSEPIFLRADEQLDDLHRINEHFIDESTVFTWITHNEEKPMIIFFN